MAGVLRGDVFVSLDELMSRARRAATGLRALGVEPGGSVALLLRNDHEFFEAAFAASALGAATVPINWHGSAEEVAYVVNDSKAAVLVAHADLLHHVRHALPAVGHGPGRPDADEHRRTLRRSTDDDAALPSDVTAWSHLARRLRGAHGHLHRRSPVDDLHLGHDRSSQGRAPSAGHQRRVTGDRLHERGHRSCSGPGRACARSSRGRCTTRRRTPTPWSPRAPTARSWCWRTASIPRSSSR